MKKTFNFDQRRDFARAFAWAEAQAGSRVSVARRAGQWRVTVQPPVFPCPAFN